MADNVDIKDAADATKTIATDEIGGVSFQRVKATWGADGTATDVSAAAPMPVAAVGSEANFLPGYEGPAPTAGRLNIEPDGALQTRAQVLTDEGTFRVNFANSSLAVSIGSPTRAGNVFTGGSLGGATLDLHVGDFVKYDADPESAWCQVLSMTGTSVTVDGYTGSASSGAASRALVKPTTGSGGTISVASGQLTIASGTTASSKTGISRPVDYAPLVFRARLSLSQRIANQDFVAGLEEDAATPRWFARVRFTGTTNTVVQCETGRNPTGAPTASEQQLTTLTVAATTNLQEMRIEVLTESVRFCVDGMCVAEHTTVIPSQHDELAAVAYWTNTGTPATSSNAVVDFVTAKNHNKIEIGVTSDREKIAVQPFNTSLPVYSVAGVISSATILQVVDCAGYAGISIQCSSMGTSGVVTPEWSNNGSTWVGCTISTPAGADATTFNAAGLWIVPVRARYLRLRLSTGASGGTTTIAMVGLGIDPSTRLATQPVSGTVTANLGTGGTGATAIGKAEDAAAASGDTGVATWLVRRDALTTSASASGDYNETAGNRFGAMMVSCYRNSARSFRSAFQVTVAASATDVFDLFGNGTTTVRVTGIRVSGIATSANQADMLLVKRSTATSGGTRAAATAVPLDAGDSAASSAPGGYSVNPTSLGTLVGAIGRTYVPLSTASGGGEASHDWVFGERGKDLVLSGTGQGIALNLNGVTITGCVLSIEVDWYEF